MSEVQEEKKEVWLTTTQTGRPNTFGVCVCVDLVGPYTVTGKTGCGRVLNAIIFIDPATG